MIEYKRDVYERDANEVTCENASSCAPAGAMDESDLDAFYEALALELEQADFGRHSLLDDTLHHFMPSYA